MGTASSKPRSQPRQAYPPPQPLTAAAPPAAAPEPAEQQAVIPRTGSGGALPRLGPMPPAEAKRWCLTIGGAKPQAAYRMVCLHWAGGNASIYRSWDLGPNVEVVAIELPGRQARLREPPIKKFEVIVQRIVQALEALGYLPSPDSSTPPTEAKPLIIFGHSFGAMLAVHITRLIQDQGMPLPALVFVSGMLPLDDRGPPTGVSTMTDDGIIEYLVKMGGVPAEVAANKDLMRVFLPAIRGDYTAIDNYVYTDAPALTVPLVAFAGQGDDRAPPKRAEGWRRFASDPSRFSLDVFPGSHFFIKEHTSLVLDRVQKIVLDRLG